MPFPADFKFPPHATLAVACSGGADSVYLVHALQEFLSSHPNFRNESSKFNVQLSTFDVPPPLLLHANHGLRGAESEGDQEFVENLARSVGWPLVTGRLPVPARATEAALRDLRHTFFRRALADRPHPVALLFGHHLDDAAESVLMRLVRGSGAAGLAAPRALHEVRPGWFHLRPLLGLRRTEIRQILVNQGLTWREDSSNSIPDPFRNKLRLELLPALAIAAGRDPAPGLARARELAEEDDDALNHWLDQLMPGLGKQKAESEKQKGQPSVPTPPIPKSEISHLKSAPPPSPASPLKSEISHLKSGSPPASDFNVQSSAFDVRSSFCFQPLAGLPAALWRRALERALAGFSPPIRLTASAKSSLLAHLHNGSATTISAGPESFLHTSRHTLTLVPRPTLASPSFVSLKSEISHLKSGSRPAPSPLPVSPAPHLLATGWRITAEQVPWPDPTNATSTCNPPGAGCVEATPPSPLPPLKSEISHLKSVPPPTSVTDQPSGTPRHPHRIHLAPELACGLQVRTWRPGDRFRPYRHPGTPKLQDLFVNHRIPRHQRHLLPIVVSQSGNIVAVAGFPPAHDARVPDSSKWALRLTFTPPQAD